MMQLFPSTYFTYKNNKLYCEEVAVAEIVKQTGTPTYIYSKNYFEDAYKEFDAAFGEIPHIIFYAAKANFNLSVIKTFLQLGSGVDVNSEGELYRALKAGANAKEIILTSVGKTRNEIKLGLEHDVLMIKAESEEEVILINEIAASMNTVARVAIRVNPDVDAKTHPYISTGLSENKFGVNSETALRIFRMQSELKNIRFTGIDMHIGSQITSVSPFVEAVEKLSNLFMILKKEGIELIHFDIGGGIGIQYKDEKTFSVKEFARAILPTLKSLNCKIIFEPGRYLTANAGILVTEVLYTKKNQNKNFLVVDAAMTDLLRPSIYGAYHHIQPVEIDKTKKEIVADVVGPVCESGDFLAKERAIQKSVHGDLLAVMSAGAYGMVMASNYNARRRPAEILVDGNKFSVIRSRETLDHLLFDEVKVLK
ncbi:MAG: diaminopimelate decarboxylase [Ignavibacteriaceae bacterium]|nr:diaminopimelate decarboxylase [Ignavibacteriaceae bacterium]